MSEQRHVTVSFLQALREHEVVVSLVSGDQIAGRLTSIDDEALILTISGIPTILRRRSVRTIAADGETWMLT